MGQTRENVLARIGSVRLDDLLAEILDQAGLSSPDEATVIETGYEDCNVRVAVDGKVLYVKMFSTSRDECYCRRYCSIVGSAVSAGVAHPPLVPMATGDVLASVSHNGRLIRACVMGAASGTTLRELGRAATQPELRSLARQLARLQTIRCDPSPGPDPWSPAAVLGVRSSAFPPSLAAVATDVRREYLAVLKALPRALAHGDLVPTNLLADGSSTVAIIDFGRADHLPVVHDLATVVAQVVFDPLRTEPAKEVFGTFVAECLAAGSLQANAVPAVAPYARAISTSYAVKALLDADEGEWSDETAYWFERSLWSLDQMQSL